MTEEEELELLELEEQEAQLGGAAPAAKGSEDPGLLASIAHKGLSGFFKRHGDELAGRLTQAKVDADPGGSVQWRDPSAQSGTRALKTSTDVYRAGRDAERRKLKGADEHHPVASFLAETGGDIASDMALRAFGVPVGNAAYQALAGAVSGAGGSDAEGAGQLPDAAIGGAAGYLVPKVGGALLKRTLGKAADETIDAAGKTEVFRDMVGRKIRAADDEIVERAGEKLKKAAGEAWGPYGQKTAEANRMLEVIDRRFAGASDDQIADALAKEGVQITGAQLTGMRDQLFRANAEKAGKILPELDAARGHWQTFKEGAGQLKDELVRSEGSLANQVMPWVKRYAPPVIGSALGGPAGAAAGMALGGGLESATGALAGAGMRPALHATLRRLAHPAMRKAGWKAADIAARLAGPFIPVASNFTPGLSELLRALSSETSEQAELAKLLGGDNHD